MISISLKSGQRRTPSVPGSNDYILVNWRLSPHPHAWRPPTDVYEHEDNVIVRVEVAGMSESDFEISLESNILIIRGNRQDTGERRAYHQMEINFGEFITGIEIQAPINPENVRAEYQNGFLLVILPKAQPKVIKVKENE